MIFKLGFSGVYLQQQEQYKPAETVTVEASITVDTAVDWLTPAETPAFLHCELDKLIAPQIARACTASRFSDDETIVYEWKGLVTHDPDSTAQDSTPQRRVRRRQT